MSYSIHEVLGIPVIFNTTGTPMVSVRVIVNAGSTHEDVPGTAHFLEHMFFKGSEKRGYEEINRIAARMGNTNAYTCPNRTVFTIDTVEGKVLEALELLLEMLFTPKLDPAEIEKERSVILEEWRAGEDDPVGFMIESAVNLVSPNRNGRPVIGTEDSIKSITANTLRDFRSKNYTRQNLAIAIIGGTTIDSEPIDSAIAGYGWYLIDSSKNDIVTLEKDFKPWEEDHSRAITHVAGQAGICLFTPWVSAAEDQNLASHVLANMLGEGMHSLLFNRLREQSGLCYATGCSPMGSWDDQSLLCYALLSPENVIRGVTEMKAVLEELALGQFDDDLLEISLANSLFASASRSETASGWAQTFVDDYFYFEKVGLIPEIFHGYDFITSRLGSMDMVQLREEIIVIAKKMVTQSLTVVMNG